MKARLIFLGCCFLTSGLIAAAGCQDEGGGLSSNNTNPAGTSSGGATSSSGGPGSGGGGGVALPADCATYCDTIQLACVDGNMMYSTDSYCSDVCLKLPAGKEGDMAGNSLACRSYYLAAALGSQDDADINCRYAGPGGEGVCGGSCENFCFLAQKSCTGEQAQWANDITCMNDCADFNKTVPYVAGATGNTYACRLYQLTLAADDPLKYCAGIGEDSEECVGEPPMPDGGMGGMGGVGGMGVGGMGGMGVGGMGGMMVGAGGLGGAGVGGSGG